RVMLLAPLIQLAVSRAVPSAPRLVVIKTTPFAAREPYIAVEAAAVSISMEAMSLGLMSANGFNAKFSVPFSDDSELDSIGTPSTTNKGLLPELREEFPRTLMVISPPGAPELEVICTPGARPCKMEIGS